MTAANTGGEGAREWVNWFGNQRCMAARIEELDSEAAIQEAVVRAVKEGHRIRPFAARHSLTAVVPSDGVLLSVAPLFEVSADPESQTARVSAGHKVQHVADRLWDAGAAMRNLGELKEATLIGAASTGVHGTGIGLQCLSGSVLRARLITVDGTIREIGAEDTDLLRAARISLGMLGVISEVTVATLPAYNLHERSFFCTPEELAERWDEMVHGNRHFSFFYLPDATTVQQHASVVPQIMTTLGVTGETDPLDIPADGDTCLVTVRDKYDAGAPSPDLKPGERYGPMDKILNYDFNDPYREIEFGVPFEKSARVFLEMRDRVRRHYPGYDQPMLVRFAAQEDSLLSWFHSGPKAIFSVVEEASAPDDGILVDFEAFFDGHGALPHWGKEHTLDAARLRRLQPGYERFREIRRELDPNGVFLNEHLKALFE